MLNIGYLTDKLPKPVYENNQGSLTERKITKKYDANSGLFPALKNSSPIINRHYKQQYRSRAIKKSNEHYSSIKNNKLQSKEKTKAK